MGDISQLPEDLIHHILSYITSREASQVSIFCKTWYNAWLTCPTLSFKYYYDGSEAKVLKFFNKTLLRYQEQKIPIVRLKLRVRSSAYVHEWIRIAVQNGVKRIDLGIFTEIYQYILFHRISEVGSLRELSLRGSLGSLRLFDGKVTFNHLNTLNLRDICRINDDMFQGIIARCPFIETLCVEDCESLKIIKVCTLYNLKKFTVRAGLGRYNVEIEAPNLQFLQVEISCGSLKLYKTENLISLTMVGEIDLPSTFLDNWEHEYPQIESLNLLGLEGPRRMSIPCPSRMRSISSPSLKRVVLKNLEELHIEIEAPNLQFLQVEIHSGSLKLYKTEKLICLSLVGDIDLPSTFFNKWEQDYPQVENLNLLGLKGHRRMSLSSHSLKSVVLKNLEEVNIEIEAPNLQLLEVQIHSGSLKLYNTEKLICLSLVGTIDLPSTFFNKWEQDYPQVENLNLLGLKVHGRMSLSSHSLKSVVLKNLEEVNIEIEAPNLQLLEVQIHSGSLKLYNTEILLCFSLVGDIDLPSTFLDNWEQEYPQIVLNCEDLREVYIDNPNLVSLELRGITVFPELYLANTQTQMVLKIFLLDCPLDTNQFRKLKQLLARWIHYKISLYMELTWEAGGFVYTKKISTCQVVQVDDLTLKFNESTKLLDSNFLEALFLTCHPKALVVEGRGDLVLFMSKKLTERNGERASWCNKLKEVKLEVYKKTIDQWQLSGRKSLKNLKNRPIKACFMLTWK